jgi:phosphoglucomutase
MTRMNNRARAPAQDSDLIDVEALPRACYERKPNVAIPEQRVGFGASGHRGRSIAASFARGAGRGDA